MELGQLGLKYPPDWRGNRVRRIRGLLFFDRSNGFAPQWVGSVSGTNMVGLQCMESYALSPCYSILPAATDTPAAEIKPYRPCSLVSVPSAPLSSAVSTLTGHSV